MKFQVSINGQFTNIKGLKIAQKYSIKIKCGTCMKEYPNSIDISEDILKEVKVKELHTTEKHNIEVECKNCKNIMYIDIFEPCKLEEVVNEDEEILYFHPVLNDKCIVSEIKSDGAFVYDVDYLNLDVVSNTNELYKNCDFNKRILVETRRNEIVDIQDFIISVDQLK